MEIPDVLGRVGVLGFLSVFQAVGAAASAALFFAARDASRAGGRAKLIGLAAGLAFTLLFTGVPLVMAHGFAGWPGLAAQVAILATLVAFVVVPRRPGRREEPAGEARRGWLHRLVARQPDVAKPAGRWRRLLSAAPAFAVAAGCVGALLGHALPGMTRSGLCHVVKVEFLVIHSFPFLAFITLPPLRGRWRVYQWFLFVTWSCLYLAFAMDGGQVVAGLVGFGTGALTTYLGFLLRWNAGNRVRDLVKRWGASFVFFMASAVIVGAKNAQVSDTTLGHGAAYFAALALAEVFGLHDLDWKLLPGRLRRRPAARRARGAAAEPVDAAR